MTELKPLQIIKFSSESNLFPASNLLKSLNKCQWNCLNGSDKEAFVEFKFDTFVHFNRIEIGNCNSAFVEMYVFDESDGHYQPLLLSTPLMSSTDAMKGEGGYKVRCFYESDLIGQSCNRRCKCLRVVCTQPFNKSILYGLSYIRFYSCSSIEEDQSLPVGPPKIDVSRLSSIAIDADNWQPGTLFSQRHTSIAGNTIQKKTVSIPSKDEKPINRSILSEEIIEIKPSVKVSKIGENRDIERDNVDQDNVNRVTVVEDDNTIESDQVMSESKERKDNVVCQGIQEGIDCAERTMEDRPSSSSIHINSQSSLTKIIKSQTNDSNTDSDISDGVLSGVSFVLSGYQNPLRNILRDNGLALGAKYRPSWTDECTHLICAFPNTPKFREVRGKAIIVSDKWMLDCYTQKRHLPWRQYRVGGAPSPTRSIINASGARKRGAENDHETESPRNNKRRRKCRPDECDTDDEIEMVAMAEDDDDACPNLSLPFLPAIFADMTFFLYRDFDFEERRRLTRLLRVFGGVVCEYMGPEVQVVVTESCWDHHFDEAIRDYAHLRFVGPDWIDECDRRHSLAPLSPYEISDAQ